MRGGYYKPKGRNTFRVWIPWKGKKLFINHYLDGTPLYHETQANRVLERVRGEIDQKTFDPSVWGKDKTLLIPNAWRVYQDQSPCGKIRYDYREWTFNNHLLPYFEDKSLYPYETISEIEEHHIKDLVSKLPTYYSPGSLKNIRNVLRAFLNYFQVTRRKVFRYPEVKVPKKAVLWLSQDDQERVFGFIPAQHQGILRFIKVYGCRSSEACNLKKTDIDWGKRTITFKERKNAIENELPIMSEVEKYLVGASRALSEMGYPLTRKAARDERPGPPLISNLHYVFCTSRGQPYTHQFLYNIWHYANLKAHQKYEVIILPLKNATRHSLASRLLEQGETLEVIARILGNSQQVVERNYGRIRTQKVMGILEGK